MHPGEQTWAFEVGPLESTISLLPSWMVSSQFRGSPEAVRLYFLGESDRFFQLERDLYSFSVAADGQANGAPSLLKYAFNPVQIKFACRMAVERSQNVTQVNPRRLRRRSLFNTVNLEPVEIRTPSKQRETARVLAKRIGKMTVRLEKNPMVRIVKSHREALQDFIANQSANRRTVGAP
jgi:hypothetical protein